MAVESLAQYEANVERCMKETTDAVNTHLEECEQFVGENLDSKIESFKSTMKDYVDQRIDEPTPFATPEEIGIIFDSESRNT